MRAFSLLVCFSSVVWARVIVTVSEYPNYCRMPSHTLSSQVPGPSSSVEVSGPSSSASSAGALPAASPPPQGHYTGGIGGGLGATAPAIDTVSQLFWTNYAEAIREAAGIEIGDNNAFFVGTQAQKGPLAGSYIPDSYFNQGLYQIANNLLNTSTMFYTPDSSHEYVQAISK